MRKEIHKIKRGVEIFMVSLKIRVKLPEPQFGSVVSSVGFSLRQSSLSPRCQLTSSLTPSFLSLICFFFFPPYSSPLSGSGCIGGQRHHQLQATGDSAAGYPCQPVWLSHREGRGQDKGDQRGEQAELTSTPSSLRSRMGSNTET